MGGEKDSGEGEREEVGGGGWREITFLLTILAWKWKIPAVM